MSRRIPVLVYGDCPELQACNLNVTTTEIASGEFPDDVDCDIHAFDLAVIEGRPEDDAALSWIRHLFRNAPGCPTVMVAEPTAYGLVETAIEAGLNDYILRPESPKPFAALFTHTIEKVLRLKSIKDRFHESERRFWTFFDHSPMGLVILGLEGQIEHANPAFTDMLGAGLDDLRSQRLETLLEESDAEVWKRLQGELRDGEHDLVRIEQQFVVDDDQPRWSQTVCVTMRDPGGEPAYFLGMTQDITDRRRIQRNLEHADKMQAMGRLAGGVAHDFNNILTIINSHCYILDGTAEPTRVDECVDRIMQATKRGSELTRKLLTFGRHSSGESETVNPNAFIDDMMVVLESLFGQSVELTLSNDDELRPVNIDPNELEQIITNLALNARDAMPDGGEFTIRTYNQNIDVPSSAVPSELPHGQYTVLQIEDTGMGMPPEVQRRAFEPFFTTKPLGEGTGLGLSTVYGAVNQRGGHISIDSSPGEGTTFTIYLPSTRPDSHTPEKLRRARESTPTDGTETILLVEDEDDLRVPLQELLRKKGYVVIPAANAEEAMELSHSHPGPIDLLLTDVIMPGTDGVTLAERITGQRPETAVLLMSGYTADALSMNQGSSQNQHKLLRKPFGMDILSRTIRRMLNSQ